MSREGHFAAEAGGAVGRKRDQVAQGVYLWRVVGRDGFLGLAIDDFNPDMADTGLFRSNKAGKLRRLAQDQIGPPIPAELDQARERGARQIAHEQLGHGQFSHLFPWHAGRLFGEIGASRVRWRILDHMVESLPGDFARQLGQSGDTDLVTPLSEAVSEGEQGPKVADRPAG